MIDINAGKGGIGSAIEEIYVVVVEHRRDGGSDEGIVGMDLGVGAMIPLVAAGAAHLPALQQKARWLARETGKVVRVLRFGGRGLVEAYHPDGRRERPE